MLCLVGLSLIVVVALAAVKAISKSERSPCFFRNAILIFGFFLVYMGIKNMIRHFIRALMLLIGAIIWWIWFIKKRQSEIAFARASGCGNRRRDGLSTTSVRD